MTSPRPQPAAFCGFGNCQENILEYPITAESLSASNERPPPSLSAAIVLGLSKCLMLDLSANKRRLKIVNCVPSSEECKVCGYAQLPAGAAASCIQISVLM
ncbi:hypothetical protein JYU34_011587 [Plutella xylostella]|uniref:Uncharacterized protein n=1 Tax=Plutella xylostella TaxID=51655 RepID=A0ABQ7QHB6_PLUXY|nr:hypothetical protein JYU34_011587 [Plutella xylostella]